MAYAPVSAQRYSDETSDDYEAFPTPTADRKCQITRALRVYDESG